MELRLGCGRVFSCLAWLCLALLPAARAPADSLPGEFLKFQQTPLAGPGAGVPYPGHDETSTAYATSDPQGQPTGWSGSFMSDDFADLSSTPVVHVGWWGAYAGGKPATGGVQSFLVTFQSDVPASGAAGAPSHPGTVLSSQVLHLGVLAPGSGTFTETLVPTGSSGPELYHYNGELLSAQRFDEQPNTVYWLTVVALVDAAHDGNLTWGWHDRDWSTADPFASAPPSVTPGEGVVGSVSPDGDVHHFQDDAVSGSIDVSTGLAVQQSGLTSHDYVAGPDGPDGIASFSKDLAFELYTVPEPGTAIELALGVAGLALASRRRA